MPVKTFPVSILQNSLKLTTEPPSGIKSNIKKLFNEITEEKTQPKSKPINTTDKKPEEIKAEQEKLEKDNIIKKQHFIKLLYSLSLFHAVLQERKKFGPIGFNLRYDFNQGDFDTSSELVNIYLSEAPVDEVPWDSIIYLIGEVTYGGSIVDETDRIVMNSTLGKFINDTLFDKLKDENGKELDQEIEFKFGDYMIPAYKTLLDYQKYITTLPNADDPQIFGLNDNANIVYQLKESDAFLGNLTSILPREVNKKAGGKTSNEIVLEIINNIFNEQIEAIDKKERNKAHDKIYDNELKHPLTIVLYQEIDKYNNLISKIETSLKELKGAIEGTSIMSYESDEIYNSLLINRIPLAWQKVGYSSFKSFISWKNDLQKRIEFIRDWLINGHPTTFWISGLFYPQGFITGVYQNHARETKIPVSDIVLEYQVMNKTKDEIKKGPDAGVYIYGLYLEGASWHEKLGLVDQKAGEMRCYMPVLWLKTVQEKKNNKEEDDDDEGEEEDEIYTYCCPMFKTGKRASIIASSGNSVEKIIDVDLPSRFKKEYWTLRGACLLTQIED
jgi:dynein heavy chain